MMPHPADTRGPAGRRSPRHNGGVSLSRIAWLATVALAAIAGLILLLEDYTGYGLLSFVVGVSAAINLR